MIYSLDPADPFQNFVHTKSQDWLPLRGYRFFFDVGFIKKLGTSPNYAKYILDKFKLYDVEDDKRGQYFRNNFQVVFKLRSYGTK